MNRTERHDVRRRCRILAAVAAEICDSSQQLIAACASDQRSDPVETISSELIPLCAALKFLGREGPSILAPRRVGAAGRPSWLWGVRSTVHRQPLGRVLILGTWNYPLLLPGVQIAQALAAGNRVELKPAIGTEPASRILADCFYAAGISDDALTVLDSDTASAQAAIDRGVDLIVLTGAAETGAKVLQQAAPTLACSIMELSGCDAVIVLPGHDRGRLIDAIRFGLCFNGGATCIGPRRLMVCGDDEPEVGAALVETLAEVPEMIVHSTARQAAAELIVDALETGASDLTGRFDADLLRDQGRMPPLVLDGVTQDHAIAAADVFAPVISLMSVSGIGDAIDLVNRCPYRLAAGVFGPVAEARSVAQRLDVGTVTINDLIAPTADPRLPFGGRGRSGFGVTRGREGLLAMTTAKVIATRRGRFLPHLQPRRSADEAVLHGLLHGSYGGSWSKRLDGLRRIVRGVKK